MKHLQDRPSMSGLLIAFMVVAACTVLACSENVDVDDGADLCDGVQCSGHGTCAVLHPQTAVCICDPGYHNEGLECVENTAGDECAGVDCSGHGTCLVIRGDPDYPVCLCDHGYYVVENTNCVSDEDPGSSVCHSSDECPSDHVCVYETGECVPESPEVCGLPDPGTGEIQLGEICGTLLDTVRECAPGLVCVPHTVQMDNNTGEYGPVTEVSVGSLLKNRCLEACDPCQPDTCGQGHCIALAAGGGFCSILPLATEGEICYEVNIATAWCEAGTTCKAQSLTTTVCQRYCTPTDTGSWNDSSFTGAQSPDCTPGEVCVKSADGGDISIWICRPGTLKPTGGACDGRVGKYCDWPDMCLNALYLNGASYIQIAGVCGPYGPDRDTCPPCPAGTTCRLENDGDVATYAVCIAPGAVGVWGHCADDVDCDETLGLTCQDGNCLP